MVEGNIEISQKKAMKIFIHYEVRNINSKISSGLIRDLRLALKFKYERLV